MELISQKNLKLANKIVLIGSTGFVGRNLKKFFLKKQIKCIYLSTKNFDLNNIKKNQIKKVIPENSIIVYAAGKHRKYGDTLNLKKYNLTIFKNLLEILKFTKPYKIIFLSTVEVYGSKNKFSITETSYLRPLNLYALSKVLQENQLKKFCVKNQTRFNILRLPGFYGKDDDNSIVSRIYLTLKGIQKIKFETNGKELRDYVFIYDLIKLIYFFIKNKDLKYDGIYNIVQGSSYQIRSYLNFFKKEIKSNKKLIFGKKKGFNLKFNNKKLKKFLKVNKFKFNHHKYSIRYHYN